MGANDKLTKRDVALGGKLRCLGCGGEWWLSGPQAEAFRAAGKWPNKCGNNPDVPARGSGDHCTDETEMVFLPYDVEENQTVLRGVAVEELLAAEAELAAAKLAEEAGGKKMADQHRALAATFRDSSRGHSEAADRIPEQAAEILARVDAADAKAKAAEELPARLSALDKEV